MRRAALAVSAALLIAGCGGSSPRPPARTPAPLPARAAAPTATPAPTRDKVIAALGGKNFDPRAIYRRESASVVTVISLFGGPVDSVGGGGAGGVGSGFVLTGDGDILTNAHVVTSDANGSLRTAARVFVAFADGNRVRARVRGYDPDADVALLKIDPAGLRLAPLPLGTTDGLQVGEPVVAMGSPYGDEQSLSVGVVSAVNRNVDSLTDFQIPGAIQTDAAINPGNSGGPLVDAHGRVIGLNQQIQSRSGGNEGVGFAVPIDLARRSADQLRTTGRVRYAYLGVSTADVYPQLAARFHLGTERGAWLQLIPPFGPAAKAGLHGAGTDRVEFQGQRFSTGGDVIVAIAGHPIRNSDDLGSVISLRDPGETVAVTVLRNGRRQTIKVKLARRPLQLGPGSGR